ncbi:hypothetical protein ASG80_20410 [Agromyces sp. Soil535]|nr:hypothetical protein ASG80_20410 [Agromyces sp. Soil535]
MIASMTDPTNPPAGWYDDGRGQQRYWDGTQWTEHTGPLAPPADQAATLPYDTAALGGTAGAGTAAYDGTGTTPYAAPAGTITPGAPGRPPQPGKVNVVGVIALVVAAVGFVLACIPFVQVGGIILLPIAFVLSIVALFLEGRKWPAITGLIVSIVGAIVGAIVFALVTLNVIGQIADVGAIQNEIEEQLEEQFGSPVPPEEGPDAAPVEGLAFGETMTWEDGVSMTVSEPETFTPSDLAMGADQAKNLAFTLTITNDSSENIQPVVFSRLASDGTEATRIFDVGADGGQVGIPPTTAILPGESITWREAWSVADPDSLTMQTAPSFQYEDAIFTNVP